MNKKIGKELFESWIKAEQKRKHWKEEESRLRDEIVDFALPESQMGTINICSDSFEIKVKRDFRFKIDKEQLNKVYSQLLSEEKECLSFTPVLSKAKYKALKNKESINIFLIEVPAKGTLTIKKTT